MSILNTFLNQGKEKLNNISEITKEVIVSKRFKDEQGNPIKWKIKAISQETSEALVSKYTTSKVVNGELLERFDRKNWQAELLVESVIDPDLKNAELCKQFGTLDPIELIKKMLLPGEYLRLVKLVMDINGYFETYDDAIYEQAKN